MMMSWEWFPQHWPYAGNHDDVTKWKPFPRYWPFMRGIHRSPVNSPHKGQWRGAWMFSLICVWTNGWVNNREAGDLRRYCAHYDVIVMDTGYHKVPVMQTFDIFVVVSPSTLLTNVELPMIWYAITLMGRLENNNMQSCKKCLGSLAVKITPLNCRNICQIIKWTSFDILWEIPC